jgi:hypothetical protein
MYSIEGEHLRQLLLRARGALWYRQNREFLADCAQLFSQQPIISDPQRLRFAFGSCEFVSESPRSSGRLNAA